MKALKTLAFVGLSVFVVASVQADEPVKVQPQGVTQSNLVESSRTPRLFGKRHSTGVMQTSGTTTMQQTTPSTTAAPTAQGTTVVSGKTTSTTVQQPVERQHRSIFSRLRGNRTSTSTMTNTTGTTSTSTTSGGDAKPMPLGK